MVQQGEGAAAQQPYISARGLTLKSPLGAMYADVTFDIDRGTCCSVVANSGEGKTELLLTIAGRMKQTSGTLTVGGYPIPRKRSRVRRMSGLGFFEHVNEVQPVLTVANVVSAELNLHSRRSGRKAVRAFLEEWGLQDYARRKIETLDRYTYVRLGIVLGLAGDPELLVVDDIESDLTAHQSLKLMDELRRIARERNIAVVVACTDYDLAVYADKALPISDSARAQARAVKLREAEAMPRIPMINDKPRLETSVIQPKAYIEGAGTSDVAPIPVVEDAHVSASEEGEEVEPHA
jgi:ABC-type cobalamin/Fe3+-siderophores transport system ATPase subunit